MISTIWIVVSDLIGKLNHDNSSDDFLLDVLKGLLFVIITSVLLYFLLAKYFTALQEKNREIYSNEEKYRTLAENLEFSVMRNDKECRYLYINKAAWELFDGMLLVKSIDEVTGLSPEQIYKDPEISKIVREGIEYVISTGKTLTKNLQYADKYVTYSKIPEFNNDGEIISVMTLIADETEVMKNLLKLEESEKFNSHLVNSSHVVVYVYDLKNKNQVYANKALERILGYTLEDIQDPKINILRDLMHPDDVQNMVKYVQTEVMQLKDGEVAEFEYRMKHKEGHYCWFKSHDCIFRRDENGFPLEILGSAIDITDFKITQKELHSKSEYLKLIIEASPMSIFDLDTKGRIKSIWNKASVEIFGWKADEVYGKELPIVPEERKHKFIENINTNISKHYIDGKEYLRKRKDGSDIHIRVYSRPIIDKEGNVEAILAYNEDITKEKKLDKTIHNTEEYLRMLYEASMEANNTVNTGEIYKKCFGYIEKILDVTGITISLVTDDNKHIKYDAVRIDGEDVDTSHIPLIKLKPDGQGPITRTIHTGKPIIISDLEACVKFSSNNFFIDTDGKLCDMDDKIENVSRAAIMIPLKYEDRVTGVLQVQSYKTDFFTYEDLHKLEPFAFIIASAMQRARLYGKIQSEFIEKSAAFEQIRKFSKGIEQSPNSIVITNSKYEIEYVNPYFTELTGYSADEVMGKNPRILQSGQTKQEVYEDLWKTLEKGETWHGEFLNLKKNGELYWEAAAIGPITDAEGNCTHYIAIKQDITEKKKQDKALKDSLDEKEIMLKEIHHRVKNNLQVISSLLNLQAAQYEHPEAIEAINSSHNRVRAMALVHESLYQSRKIGKTPLKEYIHMLAKQIYSSYGVSFDRVSFHCETNGIEFGLDTIIPLGLILNEGISNSLKHAFPGNTPGEIRIDLALTGNNQIYGTQEEDIAAGFRLIIKDNGKGLPEGFNAAKSNSLGMTLLSSLAAQLDGEAVMKNKVGTEIVINFKELKYKSRV
ncbi:MAG: PAS domain S-box protein [Ignavibacteria bacterium]|nr:PAS domain S-box protein [Ignavibacteria bacterium]